MKHCYKCGQDKEESGFYKDRSRYDGLMNTCKSCDRQKQKDRVLTVFQKENRRKSFVGYTRRIRGYIENIKEKGCVICGYSACLKAIEFHHVDPEHKVAVLSRVANIKRIKQEAAKCVLLCANCHREVHAGMHNTLELPRATHCDVYQLKLIK